ncbi:cytochrome c oxidase subunit 7A2, mitochondrial-like [Conger conger]|uniref:cytochrome c oxidase subunit 7A2, mitochondrial-like n=1 Tax=Conger conger TaxID=82655 RepID=UPI002A5A5404|nr:cytochrome c oxidase subunit 7A2, mitochondrial-like [Conger conger]
MFRHLLVLRHVSRRSISSTARRQVENKVPKYQKIFQEDNGLPVHLKGGVKDAILYRITMTLTVVGTGAVIYQLVGASFPKKN